MTITGPAEEQPADAETVTFTVTSSAPAGGLSVDVELPGNTDTPTATVTFDPGRSTADLPVSRSGYAATTDALAIVANLADGDGYTLGNPASATATIAAPPPGLPEVAIESPVVKLAGGSAVTLAVVSREAVPEGVDVRLSITRDLRSTGNVLTIQIPPGKKRGVRKLTAEAFGAFDVEADGSVGETNVFLIANPSTYAASADTTLGLRAVSFSLAAPTPLPVVSIKGPSENLQSDTKEVTFTLTADPAAPAGGFTVDVELPGNTETPTTTVRFDEGEDEATLPVPRSGYAATDGAVAIVANLDDGDGYSLGDLATATATIPAARPSVHVEVTRDKDVLEEGGELTLTFASTGLPIGQSLSFPLLIQLAQAPFLEALSLEPSVVTLTGAAPSKSVVVRLARVPGQQPDQNVLIVPQFTSAHTQAFSLSTNEIRNFTLRDRPAPVITISAPGENLPSDTEMVTFTLTSNIETPGDGLDVTVQLPGNTASETATVSFVNGGGEATLTVPRSAYAATAGDLAVIAKLVAGVGYTLGDPATATTPNSSFWLTR